MLLKLSNWLTIIAFKAKQKSLYFKLKHYIKNNETYLKKIKYWERGIGKTYTLIKLAKKFKCPIAVPNKQSEIYIKALIKDLKIKDIQIITCNTKNIINKKYNLVLCEEGINKEFIHEILKPSCKCLVGYNSNI